jgi:methylglutaconyl-CoA hydratase
MAVLRIQRDNRGIVTLVLDRPEAKNALSAELVGELTTALGTLAADATVRAVVLTGAGNVFCAGADIGEMRAAGAATAAQNEADARRFAGMLETLERQPPSAWSPPATSASPPPGRASRSPKCASASCPR